MNEYAGFNRLSGKLALKPGNFVLTAGLANCIAVAAYDKHYMAIAHFNTALCFDGNTKNSFCQCFLSGVTG